jgi:hypothetical protein
MPLIRCSACGHQISAEAESCPECGQPNRAAPRAPAGPTCYACSVPATSRCPKCGVFSCAQHLHTVTVYHAASTEHGLVSSGESHELRCEGCRSAEAAAAQKAEKAINRYFAGVLITTMVVSFLVVLLVLVRG